MTQKPPVDGWAKTSACGTQEGIIKPLSLVRSKKSGGKNVNGSFWLCKLKYEELAALLGLRITKETVAHYLQGQELAH
ncbi:hypothetical protein AALP_AA6G014600 [Arabis alpina]|uniref:Uncharacterized protein n=1 Tax=Arabis alpina TaxID=50452 RepID=A0A087GLD3_ARAAL|nr:hypothetical protein AALP_AA6G014600 [Arabis alpina]